MAFLIIRCEFSVGLMDICVCSSKKSASRLICLIASSAITTRAPHSVTIVVVCCGVLSNRALNVKVSLMCSFFHLISDVISALHILTLCSVIVFFFSPWPVYFSHFWPDCGMNVHSYCQKKVANLCGINQKLLAEALSQVSQVCIVTNCVLDCVYNFCQ